MSTKVSEQYRIHSLSFVLSALSPFRFYLVALIFILLIYSGNVVLKTQLIKMLVDAVVQTSTTLDELWTLVGHFGIVLLIELLTLSFSGVVHIKVRTCITEPCYYLCF